MTAVPTRPVWAPGLARLTVVGPVPLTKAAVALGVPSPVGPSQPVPAVQIGAPHEPLVPLVTSNRFDAWPYG